MSVGLIPGRHSARFSRFFAAYSRRLLNKRFASVRLVRGGHDLLARANSYPGPVLMLMNHASWWDPLVGLTLVTTCLPARTASAPMDLEQFRRYRFMKRLGMFGLDPSHRSALQLLTGHVAELFARDPQPLIGITPQGAFTDVRQPLRLRPGAASIAAAHTNIMVVIVCCEYTFWDAPRPEIYLHATECPRPAHTSVAGWHRQLTASMQQCSGNLARCVIQRDAAAFELLVAGSGQRIHPVYDLILRFRAGHGPSRAGRVA